MEKNLFDGEEKLKLSDLIDVNLLQELQDNFSAAMGFACATIDEDGLITKPSNNSQFCANFMRGSQMAAYRCRQDDINNGKLASQRGEPVIYTCHAGLTNFVVPIIVNGQYIASILGGQVFVEKPDENKFKDLAKELRITNENEYIKLLRKVKIYPLEHIQLASKFLFIMGNVIAGIAQKNLELKNKNKREQTLRKVIETIRSSLDINKIKDAIVEEICQILNANRCFIIEYNKNEDKFLPVKNEYLTSVDIKSSIGFDLGVEAKELEQMNREGKEITITDLDRFIDENNLHNTSSEKHFREYGVESGFTVPLTYKNEMLGMLIIHNTIQEKTFDKDEMELIRALANQIAIAIHQANLYKKEKSTSSKEIALRETIKIIRSSLDAETIKKNFLEIACNYFNADRCIFDDYNKKTDEFRSFDLEIIKDDGVKSLLNASVEEDFPEFADKLRNKKRNIIIKDVQKTLSRRALPNYKSIQTLKNSDAKSDYGLLVQYKDEIMGILILHYVKEKKVFTSEELEFLKILRDQAGIALYQAELYKSSQNQLQREALLREITERIRSSLDIEKMLYFICEEMAKLFKVQRASISEFPDLTDFSKHITRMEYKAFPTMSGLVDLKHLDQLTKFYIQYLLEHTEILAIDNIQESNTPDYFKESYTILGVKSLMIIPIRSGDDKLGMLIISEYENYRHWSNDEIQLAQLIANQIQIAIKQAKLYEASQNQVKRETLLREITERMRSSLDLDETLSFICEGTANLFNVQRTAISSFPDPKNYEKFVMRKEYKSQEDMEGFDLREDSGKTAAYWAKVLIEQGQELAIDNILEANAPEYFKNIYNSMGVKAIIGTAIRRGEDVWGTLILAEYQNHRHWTDEEKVLLRTIADQIYIAINQAELFEKSQRKAENESTLREIMFLSVQKFDLKEMINSIVTGAGKLFKADRCFFIEVDTETNINLPIQNYAEYLSSDDIVSHITRVPNKEETSDFIIRTKQKMYEYSNDISKEDLPEATKRMLIDELSVKSYLIAPVFYGNICYGGIVFHYVKDFKQFSQDEIDMAMAIANQSAVVIYKAELFETIKIQAEREKISKNIIEILRSTLDKSIIKRLFVKNIGQFLNADRVIFSEFNPEVQMYNPVSADSEYLSSPDIKSFVGFDWSVPEAYEYIQPILEKREFHIYNLHEYLQGHFVNQDLIDLFESMGIKSFYSFPVIYQQQIMGFFSIGFIRNVRRFSDEDINRLRNICTQAGIALYHAHLYEEAQKSVQKHDEFVNKLSGELKAPLSMIVEFSKMESQHEIECVEELEHLSKINDNAKKLLYLLDGITKDIMRFDSK